jgi:hypothetical protein
VTLDILRLFYAFTTKVAWTYSYVPSPRDTACTFGSNSGRSFRKACCQCCGESVWGTTSPLATLRYPNGRRKESMFRPLDMPGVPQMCFRFGSAFGTGMVIQGHHEVVTMCVIPYNAWLARLTRLPASRVLPCVTGLMSTVTCGSARVHADTLHGTG